MTGTQKPPRLLVTWAILVPLLLVVTFVLSPGVLVSVFAAAAISPAVHRAVGLFYGQSRRARAGLNSGLFDGR